MADFDIRALEIHSQYAWNFDWVSKAIRFMKAHSLNTLVLHRNDFLELIVYPGKYFGCRNDKYNSIFERYQEIFRTLYKFTPTRRSGPYQRRAYFKRVLEEARRAGITVFIENKELYFPDIILEFFPHLVKEGKVCASDPFWWEFTRAKYTEFFDEFPEAGGIISALATGESRVSIASNRCTCERCRATKPEDWYGELIAAMYEPISAAGRKLIIRDFVFSSKAHNQISSTMEQLPESIGVSLKNTPHDYYPTFPNNARIGAVGNRDQWIEFDVWGQYFGWGIAPSIMINDLRDRMEYAKARKAKGVMFRVDWESLDGHSSWDTLNQINLHAGAALANDLSSGSTGIYAGWLEESEYFRKDCSEVEKDAAAQWLGSILDQTWAVVKQTCFVNDCVFSDSSHLPVSLEHAFWLAEEKNSLKEWLPEKASALSSDADNFRRIIDEKDRALLLVKQLAKAIALGNSGLTTAATRFLSESFDIFVLYVEAFRIATHCIFLTRILIENASPEQGNDTTTTRVTLQVSMQDLKLIIHRFELLFVETSFIHRVYTLLDADRLKALYANLSMKITQSALGEAQDFRATSSTSISV